MAAKWSYAEAHINPTSVCSLLDHISVKFVANVNDMINSVLEIIT